MGRKAKEIKQRLAGAVAHLPPMHAEHRVSRFFCDPEDIVIDAYTKLDAISALLEGAAYYPHSGLGERMVGLGLLLEDLSHQLRLANGQKDHEPAEERIK
jgi:hypothetical protein